MPKVLFTEERPDQCFTWYPAEELDEDEIDESFDIDAKTIARWNKVREAFEKMMNEIGDIQSNRENKHNKAKRKKIEDEDDDLYDPITGRLKVPQEKIGAHAPKILIKEV